MFCTSACLMFARTLHLRQQCVEFRSTTSSDLIVLFNANNGSAYSYLLGTLVLNFQRPRDFDERMHQNKSERVTTC